MMNRKSGFTLIEMMTVVVIIAIVASITMASAQYLIKNSRRQRARITCDVLENALTRYRHEYKEWPGLPSNLNDDVDYVTFVGKDNAKVFGPLRVSSADNPKQIQFIDESALLTASTYDKQTSPLADKSGNQPLAYRAPTSGHARFFKVIINVDDDTAEVQMSDDKNNATINHDRD